MSNEQSADDPVAQLIKDNVSRLKNTTRTEVRETAEFVSVFLGMLGIGISFGATWMGQRAIATQCQQGNVFITDPCASQLERISRSIAEPAIYGGMVLILLGYFVSPVLAPYAADVLDGGAEA